MNSTSKDRRELILRAAEETEISYEEVKALLVLVF